MSIGHAMKGSAKSLTKLLWLLTLALPLHAAAETVEYVHTDALGTPIAITDASGNLIETSEYEPYGKLLNRPLTDGPGFTGHVQDAATGLTYMQQRYYDPVVGRFLSADPINADIGPVGTFNRYWYANGSPYRFLDPDGRQSCENSGGDCSVAVAQDKEPTPLPAIQVTPPPQNYFQMPVQNLGGITVSATRPNPVPNSVPPSDVGQDKVACPTYGDRYLDHLDNYLINVGPYATALFVGTWPKSLSPATGFRGPLLGSKNWLTSVPRGFGVPGGASAAVRVVSAGVGLATVAIGMYNVGVFGSGLVYAIPSDPGCE